MTGTTVPGYITTQTYNSQLLTEIFDKKQALYRWELAVNVDMPIQETPHHFIVIID